MRSAVVAFFMAAVLAFGCSGPSGNEPSPGGGNAQNKPAGPDWSSPQGAMKELQAAFASGDSARLLACFSAGTQADMKRKIERDVVPVVAAGGSFRVEYNEADLKPVGDQYRITVKLTVIAEKGGTPGTEDEDFTLVKENGGWKVENR